MSEDKARVSEIIEAYTKGYEDGTEAVKKTFAADGIVFEKMNEPQTMYYPQVDGITPSVIVPQTEPQTEDLIKQADALIEFEKELLKDEPQTERSE